MQHWFLVICSGFLFTMYLLLYDFSSVICDCVTFGLSICWQDDGFESLLFGKFRVEKQSQIIILNIKAWKKMPPFLKRCLYIINRVILFSYD